MFVGAKVYSVPSFNTTLVSVQVSSSIAMLARASVSIQRLYRFKREKNTETLFLIEFQYNACIGSRSRIQASVDEAETFQYNACIGSRVFLPEKFPLSFCVSIQRLYRFKKIPSPACVISALGFNTTLVSVQGSVQRWKQSIWQVSIQRLYRFKASQALSKFTEMEFQYNACIGSSMSERIFDVEIRMFQYNACIGSRLPVTGFMTSSTRFNTTLVSVQARVNQILGIKEESFNTTLVSVQGAIKPSISKVLFSFNTTLVSVQDNPNSQPQMEPLGFNTTLVSVQGKRRKRTRWR